MNSPDVAAALSAGAPDAAGRLYDAHAEALYQYCWLTLRDRQEARTAVCDALVQAGARVAELSDPGTLRAWLFALVRAECHHHPLPSLGDTDEAIARPEQSDSALRIMAWNSVMSLDLVQRQALDLATRHGMTDTEISLILGLPLDGTTELLASARTHLERALGAEILVSRDSLECPGRTEAIRGWTGTVTPEFRDRLLTHAGSCPHCRPRLPRNVSPGRIFGLLPAPALDREARSWVIGRVGELIRTRLAEADLGGPEAARPGVAMPGVARPGMAGSEPAGPDPLTARVDPAPTAATDPPAPAAPAGPPPSEPVVPDPVVTDPVVPDPAVPDPVVPDPAASPHIVGEHQDEPAPVKKGQPASVAPTTTPAEATTRETTPLPRRPPEQAHEPPASTPAEPTPLAAQASEVKPVPVVAPAPQIPKATPVSGAASASTARPAPARSAPRAPKPAVAAPRTLNPRTPARDTPRPAPRTAPRRRLAPRIFAGAAAAVVAAGVAAGLAVGSTSGHARLSGSDSQLVTGSAAPSQAAGQPDPRPDAPPARPSPSRRAPGKSATTAPAIGGADTVASGKQAGANSQPGQATRRTGAEALAPRTQAAQAGPSPRARAVARLTVGPASLELGQGSSGHFTLTASGGPVSWSASASSGHVSLSPASGQLGSGHRAMVNVTVSRAGDSGGRASVSINGAVVSVSWSAIPAPSASSAPSGAAPSGAAPSGAPGGTGASGGSGSGAAGTSPPPVRRHHRPSAGGSPAAS
jgi:DNA-directed RNA polymerase specialized sigma24 family protein